MKKFLTAVAAISMVLSLVACGSSNAGQDSSTELLSNVAEENSLQSIKDKGQLVLGTSADYAPYEFHLLEDGQDKIVGFDINIAQAIADEIGVELKVVDMNFDGLITALNSGQVDMVMAGMTPTPERMEAVDFSDIYYLAEQSVITRTDDVQTYSDIASLEGKKVAAQRGSLQEGIVNEQLPKSNLVSLTKIPNIILELKNKNVEAAIVERPVAEGYIKQYPEISISDIAVKDETGGSAIAMAKGSTSLVEAVNGVIAQLQSDGSIDKFVIEANEMVVVEDENENNEDANNGSDIQEYSESQDNSENSFTEEVSVSITEKTE